MRYVLITPARNEAAFIELTIQSVIAQTVTPLRWVIVSDGSTDGTDDIVKRYAADHQWIELVRMPDRRERHFAGKAHAFNAGFRTIETLHYDVIGSLDADITFDPDYFAYLLGQFAANARLGVAGTPFTENSRQYDYRFASVEHVSGACQLFRRKCFEQIGGYQPITSGGIDLIAVITARMQGWETRSFVEKTSVHHRPMGSANKTALRIAFKDGWTDYTQGCDPRWEFMRSIYQMSRSPVIVRGCLCLAGYVCAMVTRSERVVSRDVIEFRKREQMQRLSQFFRAMWSGGRMSEVKRV